MRHLVSGSLARRISWTLVTTLVLPLLILAMPPRQAHAQLSTPLKSVAVLDFGVLTSSPTSAILGRNATDATVVELQHTGRYDVTSRQALDQQLRDLDLSAPLDNIGIQKLGGALGVDYVASGDITAISFTENPRRAKVALSVRLTDVVSGELANGAIETGYSSASPAGFQADDDTLISQAIQEAAYSAVRTITQYTLPEATVLQNVDTTSVILNRGARDGLYAGLVMTVVRGRDRIGRVSVTSVNESDSVARVLDYGKGIRPEDRARAVFTLPGYDVLKDGSVSSRVPDTGTYNPRSKRGRPVLTAIFEVVAAVFLATLLFDKKSRLNGNGVSNIKAQAFSEVSVAGETPNGNSGRVQVTWQTSADIPSQNIIEYHVYRDEQIIGVTQGNQTTFFDSPTFSNNQNATGTLTFNTVSAGGGTGNVFGGGNATSGSGLVPLTVAVAPLTVGVPHHYRISVVYQQLLTQINGGNTGTGGTGTGTGGTTGTTGSTIGNTTFHETNVLSTSGQATPIARPATTSASIPKDLSNLTITFTPSSGADQYVIEFAKDPGFSKKVTRGPFFISPGLATATTGSIDIKSSFTSVPANGSIYYRVGMRNSQDSPGPTPINIPNGSNYIYSNDGLSFKAIGNPPNPPGS